MDDGFAARPIAPAECALALAIPATRDAFLARRRAGTSDFVATHCRTWQKYVRDVVRHLEPCAQAIRACGVAVEHEVSLAGFGALVRRFRAVSLFAHWRDDAVELADGLVSAARIVEQVPLAFVGIVDLCVCHPEPLASLLRDLRPGCLVRTSTVTATPRFWAYYYAILYRALRERPTSYLDAMAIAVDSLRGPRSGPEGET